MYEDASGPEMARLLKEMSNSPDFALNMIIRNTAVVPDDIGKQVMMHAHWQFPLPTKYRLK